MPINDFIWAQAAVAGIWGVSAYVPLQVNRLAVCMGAMGGVGAYVGAVAMPTIGPAGGVLAAGAGGVVAGFLMGFLLGRLSGLGFALGSLAIGELIRLLFLRSPSLGGALGFTTALQPDLRLPLVGALGMLLLGLWWDTLVQRKRMVLLGHAPRAGAALGLREQRATAAALALAGGVAGVAGGLYLQLVGLFEPSLLGFQHNLEILIFALLGGRGSVLGPFMAGAIMVVVPEVLRFSDAYRMILFGALVIGFVVMRPDGVLTMKQMLRVRRLGHRLARRNAA